MLLATRGAQADGTGRKQRLLAVLVGVYHAVIVALSGEDFTIAAGL